MAEDRMQKQELARQVKCAKCGRRYATDEDQLCDACRFSVTLEVIVKSRD